MQTGYSGVQGNCPRYVCARAKQLYGGEKGCQSIGGRRLEQRVLDELFAVLAPAALTATAQALADAEQAPRRHAARVRAGRRAGPLRSRAAPAASSTQSSRRTGSSPAPWNARWKSKLAAQRQAERDLTAQQARRPVQLTEAGAGLALARRRRRAGGVQRAHHHVPGTQATAPRDPHRGRRHRRCRPHAPRASLRIIWQGGACTELTMPMTKPASHFRATDEDTIALVRRLAEHYDDTHDRR